MNVITVEDLKSRLASESSDVFLLDIREDREITMNPMQNAGEIHHIAMGDVKEHLNDIPRDKTVVVICRSGARSGMVVEYLLEQDYDNVANLIGGVMAWEQSNA